MLKLGMQKFNLFKILLLIFILLLFSGCSKKEETIKFSSWGSESEIAVLKPVLKEFEKENPDVKIEFIHIPKNYFQKLHLLVASKLTPDVMFLNNTEGVIYAKNNILLDLSGYLNSDSSVSEKDFFAKAVQAFRYKNKLYAIPRDISNLVIYYNKDIFDKYKVPYPKKNWDFNDLLVTAKRLTKDFNGDGKIDRFGIGFEEMPLFWTPFLWSNSGGIISPDLKHVLINKSESIKSLQFYTDLRNVHHVAPSASEQGSATTSQLFMQGKIAMQISGRWNVPRYRKDLKFRWDIARFPAGKAGSIVDADTSGWAISKSSKHPDKAWRLVKFLAGRYASQKFTESGLIVPARIDVANSDVFLNSSEPPKNSKIFIAIIPESMPTPANENYQEITDILTDALAPVWSGDKKAKDVITGCTVKKINDLIDN